MTIRNLNKTNDWEIKSIINIKFQYLLAGFWGFGVFAGPNKAIDVAIEQHASSRIGHHPSGWLKDKAVQQVIGIKGRKALCIQAFAKWRHRIRGRCDAVAVETSLAAGATARSAARLGDGVFYFQSQTVVLADAGAGSVSKGR